MANYILLNVGCGPVHDEDRIPAFFKSPEWCEIRLDLDPGTNPDIVASITDMSCVLSDAVDCVWSSHNLEHLYGYEVERALKEFLRVLKPSGFAYLKVPDLELVAQLVVAEGLDGVAYESPAGPVTPLDIIYGHGPALAAGNHYMAHRTGFTPRLLQRILRQTGFGYGVMKRKDLLELSALVFKSGAQEDPVRDRILAELEF
jgi:SAM-dependent methyltransferase